MGQIQESVIDLLYETEDTGETISDNFLFSEDDYLELMIRKYPKKINNIPKTIHFEESQRSNIHSSI